MKSAWPYIFIPDQYSYMHRHLVIFLCILPLYAESRAVYGYVVLIVYSIASIMSTSANTACMALDPGKCKVKKKKLSLLTVMNPLASP